LFMVYHCSLGVLAFILAVLALVVLLLNNLGA